VDGMYDTELSGSNTV